MSRPHCVTCKREKGGGEEREFVVWVCQICRTLGKTWARRRDHDKRVLHYPGSPTQSSLSLSRPTSDLHQIAHLDRLPYTHARKRGHGWSCLFVQFQLSKATAGRVPRLGCLTAAFCNAETRRDVMDAARRGGAELSLPDLDFDASFFDIIDDWLTDRYGGRPSSYHLRRI